VFWTLCGAADAATITSMQEKNTEEMHWSVTPLKADAITLLLELIGRTSRDLGETRNFPQSGPIDFRLEFFAADAGQNLDVGTQLDRWAVRLPCIG
jgi:hypothetical protein